MRMVMDQEQLGKFMAAREFGQSHLQNPQDLAYFPPKDALAVADESNGLVLISAQEPHGLVAHLRQCADACSICYNEVHKYLVVGVTKAISGGDDTPGELQFFDHGLKSIKSVTMPGEPKVKSSSVRWVASDPVDGDVWMASGDNELSALWRYSMKSGQWKTMWQGDGDLEHPSFLKSKDSTCLDMVIVRWSETENWTLNRWIIDNKKGEVISQKPLPIQSTDIAEPWSAAADLETGYIYAYDYKSGAIQPIAPPTYNKVDVIGMTRSGQWTAIAPYGSYVYVSSSDERCIRSFIKRY